jgi:feruloyl esterase
MKHQVIWFVGALLALPALATRADECGRLTGMPIEHGMVVQASVIHAGTSIPTPRGDTLPAAAADYCRIQATLKPTADSDIHFELWIPSGAAWNGKFEQVGNGGFAGSLPYRLMLRVLSLGYAVAGTDDGHQSSDSPDARWAENHPEKIKDFGWRAIEETAVDSKRLVRKLTSKTPSRSYFVGCSDGGREALMMAERYPTYFDGIVAGAPAYSMTRLFTSGALRYRDLDGAAARFTPPQLDLLQHQALQACAGGAAYIKDPRHCRVDIDSLQCAAGATEGCLSAAQIKTARVLYADRKDPRDGATLYGVLPGAEAVRGSWDAWLTGTDDKTPPAGLAFTWNYLAFMVMNDAKIEVNRISDADLVRGERTIGPEIDAAQTDLKAFKAHGGKLIQYHGWNDPGIPPGYSLEYHDRVLAGTPDAQSFYRLYMVPGMLHCIGGDAPTLVNWQAALESWVEKSAPPGELIAGDGQGATQTLRPFE